MGLDQVRPHLAHDCREQGIIGIDRQGDDLRPSPRQVGKLCRLGQRNIARALGKNTKPTSAPAARAACTVSAVDKPQILTAVFM